MKKKIIFLCGTLISLILLIQGLLSRDYFPVNIIGYLFGTSSNIISILVYTLIIFMIKFSRFFVMPFTMIEKNPDLNGSNGTLTVLGIFKFPLKVGSATTMTTSFFQFLREFFIWIISVWSALMLVAVLSPFGIVASKGSDLARSVADFYLSIYLAISLIDVYLIKSRKAIDQLGNKIETQIQEANQNTIDSSNPNQPISTSTANQPVSELSDGSKKLMKVVVVVVLILFITIPAIIAVNFGAFGLFLIKNKAHISQPISQPINVPDFKDDSQISRADIDLYGDKIINKRVWIKGTIRKQSGINGEADTYILEDAQQSLQFVTAPTPEYKTADYLNQFIDQKVNVHAVIRKIVINKSPDGKTESSYIGLEPVEKLIIP